MKDLYNVCIIGGGASGLAAAVYIKQKNKEMSVAVIERLPRVGKKLITTGNGRCNITNKDEALAHYHGENAGFAEYAIRKYDNKQIEEFFYSIGVPICYDETGRGYPASFQASSVVDALRFSCTELRADVFTEHTVTAVDKTDCRYTIKTDKAVFYAENVIFAAGLYSGGVKIGCDGSVLKLLSHKGFKTVKTTPAIVQIKTENSLTRQLKGIKVNATARLCVNGVSVSEEYGEVLFCDYGLSGPPILRISREVERSDGVKTVLLDLAPDMSFDYLKNQLLYFKSALSYRTLEEYLSGIFNKRLGQVILKSVGYKLSTAVCDLDGGDIEKISHAIKNFEFRVISTLGFDNSQVTAGGLDTTEFDNKTMMSKKFVGLYAIGELLDIDGDCGGYNLHFAFSSAFCASDNIIEGYING